MATAAKPAEQGSIYAYETRAGTRYRFTFRDDTGRQTTRRGFATRAAARRERERLMGRVHGGELRVSRETLAGYFERYLASRRPYLEPGTYSDYLNAGERRILPTSAIASSRRSPRRRSATGSSICRRPAAGRPRRSTMRSRRSSCA